MYCQNCNSKIEDQIEACPMCGHKIKYIIDSQTGEKRPEYGMKWFKFITYFQLFILAGCNFYFGIKDLIIANTDKVYLARCKDNPGLRILENSWAVSFLIFGLLAIYIRQLLVKYKEKGPRLYLVLYIALILTGLIYTTIKVLIYKYDVLASLNYSYMIKNVTMLIVNYLYFRNRKFMFNK